MTTETLPAVTDETEERARKLALLKAIGLDRVPAEQRELALNIAKRYELDLLLKHLVLIDGKPYVTRDALLHVAHRSGQFDGIACTEPVIVDGYWRCTATVWRKDMSHAFEYPGRYPTTGGNQKFAPEMAIKVAESMALRRAFNVAAPVVEERWDQDIPEPEPQKPLTLAERAAAKRAEVEATTSTDHPISDAAELPEAVPAGTPISVPDLGQQYASMGGHDEPPPPTEFPVAVLVSDKELRNNPAVTTPAPVPDDLGVDEPLKSRYVYDDERIGKLCGNKGSLDTVCNMPLGHSGKHRELATDGRVLASW